MPYLIDGHNLIPKVPGLSLRALDDELQLVEALQAYCRVSRRAVEVFFDAAPPGCAGTKRFGAVTAHFVRQGLPADEAIIARLRRAGRQARNLVIVTSDRRIQAEARACQAQVISSEEFAASIIAAAAQQPAAPADENGPKLSSEDVERWLKIFDEKDPPAGPK